ncbi:phosphate ABC transporter substrate-binding protein PstS [filamentous cyanobacterium LEGE 11480]|uniref:Phosphate-binding protein n=1 Tax=Romeriopsis navalis LEGE 11480 TaxID=2777977 RepID=A0A928VR59_9CYAN|nr:phosphate ABC transporter substrate-binding protein PstS [Romeriopsis navalis]MBE9030629.1 phosphate ABC transporter substrate-binding protein PstS [Romeriopsis navalis LEGE 11480]
MALSRSNTRWATSASLFALTVSLTACGGSSTQAPTAPGSSSTGGGSSSGVALKGAGASAPAPLYQKWFAEYAQKTGTKIGYESVGSGAGIKQYLAETVDFGATDAALKDKDRAKFPAKRGSVIQVPSTGLFVVFAHNLEGVTDLKLSRDAYCGIVDGSVTKWNDAKITADNAGVDLPDSPITFVHRSDGSGTTSIFTKHIEKACSNWKAGAGKAIEWPTGTGAKGNEGVTAQIQQTPGAIGYIEYSYANENGLNMAALKNKAGEYVKPTPESAGKALSGVKIPDDFALSVPDPEAEGAYPIVSLTWLLIYGQYDDASKSEEIKKFVTWAMKEGKPAAEKLGYIPLPEDVSAKVIEAVEAAK